MSEGSAQNDIPNVETSWGRAVLAFVFSIAVGGALFGLEERNHQTQLRLEIKVTAQQAGKRLSDWIEDRMNLSTYLAEKWDEDYRENVPQYRKDAAQFVEKFPGFQALNWIDPEGVIRVVVPLLGNEKVLNVDLTQTPVNEVRDAVRRAREEQRPTRTPATIELIQGGKGFATYWPIFDDAGDFNGYINAVFRVDELIETCLSRIQVTNQFLVAIREQGGALVYPVDAGEGVLENENAVVESIQVIDRSWDLYLVPSPSFYHSRPLDTHYLILPIALLVGFFLATVERLQSRRKRALLLSQALYQNLFDQAPIGYLSARADGVIVRANHVAARLTGRSKLSLSDQPLVELFPSMGKSRGKIQSLLDAVRGGEPIRVEEIQMTHVDRGPFWALVSVEGVLESDARFSHFRLAIRDISQRKESEEARSCLSAAMEQAEEGLAIANAMGTVQYVNPAFRSTKIHQQSTITQQPLTEILRRAGVDENTVNGLGDAMHHGRRWQGTYTITESSAHAIQVVASLSPLHDDEGTLTHFVLLQRDVTHEEELQAQLRQAQKMEAIGRLAGGIAHDFNNILQSLLGYATLARKSLDDSSEVDHCLVEIERSGHRAAELVALILAFGRKADEVRVAVSLVAIVHEVVNLVRGSLPENIVPVLDIGPVQHPIVANSTQMHQILMNLISNAKQAMETRGGTLTVRVGAVTLDELDVALLPGLHAGCFMKLSVEDTGAGMSDDTLDRIFEPYFTTREQKRGSGLGLAMVHGLVEQYGGTIRVESHLDVGTAFHVYLPVDDRASLAQEPIPATCSEDIPQENRPDRILPRILFVDDEAQIVDSMTRILRHFGFEVTGHTKSTDAVNAFRENPTDFDLVVTDLSMPELNGIDLASALNEIRGGIPVILCSGYGETHGRDIEENEHLIARYLKKPITAAKLRNAILEVFNAEAT